MTVNREKPARRAILSSGVSFWAVAAIGVLAAATNAPASPRYRVYQLQFRLSATTLTLLFTVYVVVRLVTLVFLGSASDYLGRRPVMLAAQALGAVASGLVLLVHGFGLLFAGRAAALGGNAHAGKADASRCGCGALLRAPCATTVGDSNRAIGAP